MCAVQLLNSLQWKLPGPYWLDLAAPAMVLVARCRRRRGGSSALVLFLWRTGRQLPIRNLRLPVLVLAATVGPILEDVIFRGLILSALLYALAKLRLPRGANVLLSILAAALLFGLAHHSRGGVAMCDTVLMGILYGWLRVQSGSTAVAAAAHSGFNIILHLLLL